jgi:hypothetical protein
MYGEAVVIVGTLWSCGPQNVRKFEKALHVVTNNNLWVYPKFEEALQVVIVLIAEYTQGF